MAPIGTFLSFVSTVIGGAVGETGGSGLLVGLGIKPPDEVKEVDCVGGGFVLSTKLTVNEYGSELQPKFQYVL